jgi:hypothetical protein
MAHPPVQRHDPRPAAKTCRSPPLSRSPPATCTLPDLLAIALLVSMPSLMSRALPMPHLTCSMASYLQPRPGGRPMRRLCLTFTVRPCANPYLCLWSCSLLARFLSSPSSHTSHLLLAVLGAGRWPNRLELRFGKGEVDLRRNNSCLDNVSPEGRNKTYLTIKFYVKMRAMVYKGSKSLN